jgi:hypothetical protein
MTYTCINRRSSSRDFYTGSSRDSCTVILSNFSNYGEL